MIRTAKVGIVLLALLLFVGPTVACMFPGLPMSAAEKDCCKKMAEQCGGVSMPASHTCCTIVSKPDLAMILKAEPVIVPSAAAIGPVRDSEDVFAALTFSSSRTVFESHSPPDPFCDSVQILRI